MMHMGARAARLRRSGPCCINSLKSRYHIDEGTHQRGQKCHRRNKAYGSEAAHLRLAFGNPGLILRIVFAQEQPSHFQWLASLRGGDFGGLSGR
jgi:hypothetical protein